MKHELVTLCKMLYFQFKEIALKNEDYTLLLLRININLLMPVWFVLFKVPTPEMFESVRNTFKKKK